MKIYISGPISNRPNKNREAFEDAWQALREAGHKPINPLEYTLPEMTWEECMKRVIPYLLDSDGVALLDGWLTSRGAFLEEKIAFELGIKRKSLEEWL